MRDFSYKMQQMRDFRCKKQGREPGRPKKKMPKKKIKSNLISRPKRRKEGTKERRKEGGRERRKEGGRERGTKEGKREKGKKELNNFFLMLSSSLISPSLGGSRKNISRSKTIKPNLPLNLDEIGNNFF